MECKLKNRSELIANYLMGELPENEVKAFEEHYFQCETCFKELRIAEDAMNLIKQEGKDILAAKKLSGRKSLSRMIQKFTYPNLSVPKRWGIAVAAIAALIFLIIFINRNDQEIFDDKITSDDKKSLEGKDSLKQSPQELIKDKDFVAELTGPAFVPEPYLEEWITENVRSGRDEIDTVFSPKIAEKFYDKKITFQWKMKEPSKDISFKIMNNLEKEIYTSTLNNQSSEFIVQIDAGSFKQPGLYYWRIEDENEVLFTGKFYFLQKP